MDYQNVLLHTQKRATNETIYVINHILHIMIQLYSHVYVTITGKYILYEYTT